MRMCTEFLIGFVCLPNGEKSTHVLALTVSDRRTLESAVWTAASEQPTDILFTP